MFIYPAMPIDIKEMKLEVSNKEFVAAWKTFHNTRTPESYYELYKLCQPWLQEWKQRLLQPASYRDVITISFLALFGDVDTALIKVKAYLKQIKRFSSIEEELQELLHQYIYGIKYFPGYAYPESAVFVFVQGYKLLLKDRVKSINRKLPKPIPVETYDNIWEEPLYPDYYLIDKLDLTPWEEYLFELIRQELTVDHIAKLTHTRMPSIWLEEKRIWMRIYELLSITDRLHTKKRL